MANAKKATPAKTNLQQQGMKTEQKPGQNQLPKKPLSHYQRQGYAMRGAKKSLKQMGCM